MSDILTSKRLLRLTLACAALLGAHLSTPSAQAQQGYPPPPGGGNPMCVRLEAQLAMIDRGGGTDPARAEQIRRYEEAASRQQAELDRIIYQARQMGCESSGFFSMFSNQPAQCTPLNHQIQQMRGNLDQVIGGLERLRVGTPGSSDRSSQRRSVLLALAQNNCGPQYAAAARSAGPGDGGGGFFDNIFGNNHPGYGGEDMQIAPPESGAPSGTFRTVCVRSCDGYYFPISFATVPSRFGDDERACKNQCPAAEAQLYTYRNPGEDMNHAVSLSGAPYSSSANAFRYRQSYNPSCSCKAAGQTWSDALKAIDDKGNQGDIIVTEERAKRMAQPPATKASNRKPATPAAGTTDAATPSTAGGANQIRSVGPTFLPKQQ